MILLFLNYVAHNTFTDFKNPIQVAAKVLHESDQGPLSLGRIPPLMLVGPGVAQWVNTMGYQLDRVEKSPNLGRIMNDDTTIDNPPSLVSKPALEQYIHYNGLLQQSSPTESSFSSKRKVDSTEIDPNKRHANNNAPEDDLLNDTVGAICVDRLGRVAAGVSSGGIALKFPGRVSEAALFGAGCWAQDPTHETAGFACSVTGAGEQITKTLLAKTCMEQLVDDDDTSSAAQRVLDRFITSPLLRSYKERHAGFVALKIDPIEVSLSEEGARHENIRGEFVYGHTTPTMVKNNRQCFAVHDKSFPNIVRAIAIPSITLGHRIYVCPGQQTKGKWRHFHTTHDNLIASLFSLVWLC